VTMATDDTEGEDGGDASTGEVGWGRAGEVPSQSRGGGGRGGRWRWMTPRTEMAATPTRARWGRAGQVTRAMERPEMSDRKRLAIVIIFKDILSDRKMSLAMISSYFNLILDW
jgi:hypothetical protein